MAIERRNNLKCEYRLDEGDGNTLVGYAARFKVWSEPLGFFKERILPGAFKETINNDDIRALFNHDANFILGRTRNKTLTLEEDDKGLHFSLRLPDTSYAQDLKESIRRRDITQNSFGFQVAQDGDEWSDDRTKRELIKVKLFDISPVTFPAYKQTSVKLRFLEAGINFRLLEKSFFRCLIGDDSDDDRKILKEATEIFNGYWKESETFDDRSEAEPEISDDALMKMKIAQIKSRMES